MRDLAFVESCIKLMLLIENPCLPGKDKSFFPSDLCYCSTRSQVPTEDLEVAGRLDRVRDWADDYLILRKRGERLDVLCECFASDGRDVPVHESRCDE